MAAKRAIIYCRVSSNDLERDSLSAQERECKKYCETRGYRIVETLKESERGQSGADLYAPALQQALSLARQGRFDILVCRDITRYTRSKRKAHITDITFEDCNVSVEFVWNQFGEDNEYSEILKDMLYFASEQAKKDSVERMRNGRMNRIEEGSVMVHAHPPYGYRVRKENRLFRAYIQPDEAKLVELIYHLFVIEGLSIRGVTKELNRRKYVTKRRHKWHPGAVHRILTEAAYKGEYHYGNGKNHRVIPIQAIISQDLFNKAQKKLAENANEQGRKAIYKYLLSRRVKCACGFSMSAKAREKGKRLFYSCNRYQQGEATGKCTRYVRAEQVDKIVWDWLESLLRDKDLLEQKMNEYLKEQEARLAPLKTALTNVESLLKRAENRYQRLLDLMLESDAFGLLMDKKLALETEINELETERENITNKLADVELLFNFPGDLEPGLRGRYLEFQPLYKTDLWEFLKIAKEPTDFKKRREYIERFNVRVEVIQDDLGIWLNIKSDLGNVLSELSQNPRTG